MGWPAASRIAFGRRISSRPETSGATSTHGGGGGSGRRSPPPVPRVGRAVRPSAWGRSASRPWATRRGGQWSRQGRHHPLALPSPRQHGRRIGVAVVERSPPPGRSGSSLLDLRRSGTAKPDTVVGYGLRLAGDRGAHRTPRRGDGPGARSARADRSLRGREGWGSVPATARRGNAHSSSDNVHALGIGARIARHRIIRHGISRKVTATVLRTAITLNACSPVIV